MELGIHSVLFLLGVSFLNVFAQSAASYKQVLEKILQRAKETHSSSVLVIKDGKTIGEDYDSKTDGFDDFISLVLQFGK